MVVSVLRVERENVSFYAKNEGEEHSGEDWSWIVVMFWFKKMIVI